MPLLLAGQPYEYPRRKANDALNEFCDSIVKARKDSGKGSSIVPLESREVKNIPGDSIDTLIVVQREFANIAGASNTKVRDAVVGMPTKIASVDATTCLILALTNAATGDVAVAHIDSERQIDKGLSDMLKVIGVPSIECKSAVAGAAVPETPPVVKVAMLGCVLFHEYSPVTLSTLLKKFIGTTDVAFDIGFGFDVAVWSLNWNKDKNQIRRRGLLIDTAKNVEGELLAIECQGELRAYPDVRLRSLRSFAKDPHLSSVTLFKGEESALKISQKESRVQEITTEEEGAKKIVSANASSTEAGAANSAGGKIRSVFKIVIRPFEWPAMLQDAARKPLEWFYQLSSTPDMEPEDFANSVKQAVIFGNLFPATQVFNNGRPRLYVGDGESKKWTQI